MARLGDQVTIRALLLVALALGSSASEEKTTIIDASSMPSAPAQSVEARIALRQHREAVILNRFLFSGNVLEGIGDLVDHWIVMFCPGWHDKCQALLPSYELLGVQWENKLNKALVSSRVRFAKVDCATEKALCVSLDIDDYPSVVHYHDKQRIASWHGGAPGLVRFVKEALEGPKRRPSNAGDRSRARAPPVCDAAGIVFPDTADASGDRGYLTKAFRAICFVLMLLAAGRSLAMLAPWSRRHTACLSAMQLKPDARQGGRVCVSHGDNKHRRYLPPEWADERQAIVL